MTPFEWTATSLSVLSVLGIPALALVIRLTIRFTVLADRLTAVAEGEEKAHTEMYRTMREDRAVTDKRLRWLEENLWRGGRRPGP